MSAARKYNFEINEKTKLLWIAGPLFLEMLLNVLLHNVDTMMLSHYDEMAVGAVGNVGQILSMMTILFGVISMATSVIVSQYLGAKEFGKMNQLYTLGVAVNLLIGLVLSGSVVLFGTQIMNALHVSPEMFPHAMTYLRIAGGTMFLMAVYNVMMQILRCNGFPKFGLYISFLMNIINICGNYLFLYGSLKHLEWGVAGVALSTVIARIAALTAAFIFFYRNGIGRVALKYIRPFPSKLLYKMARVGLPSAGEQLSYNLYQMCFMVFINQMGNYSVNAKIYSFNLVTFTHLFSFAAATGTQIIVGHLVGADKEDEAFRRVFKTLWTSLPITLGLTLINWIFAPYTLGLFTSNPEIIKIGQAILFVSIFVEAGRCLNLTFIFSLRAAGSYVFPLIIGLITMWGIGLPLGYTLGVIAGLGVSGIFIGTAADECVRGLVVAYYWYKRKWTGKKLV